MTSWAFQENKLSFDGITFPVEGTTFLVEGTTFRLDDTTFRLDSTNFPVIGVTFLVVGTTFLVEVITLNFRGSMFLLVYCILYFEFGIQSFKTKHMIIVKW